ncbi:hypothetical protein ACFQY4_22515 [Catellatospora bangladeshensis]|uniref:hypothetical protein n=1 Tax=Catellatospora bangladeshensis TaxID=310355 RepID=UPI00360B4B6D
MRTRVMNMGMASAVALGLFAPPADPPLPSPGGFAAARAAMAAAGPRTRPGPPPVGRSCCSTRPGTGSPPRCSATWPPRTG